ncbi:Uncharacterized protein APZ42_027597 [Daphnia magna]|uniref:Uncharacterized protein n=1 Tax=Daphnia magna TaxID=35525 RepID=A0A164R8B5_9CRUS|nr:Uncharacterized protein APZ42_027597 [Daphnia magna]
MVFPFGFYLLLVKVMTDPSSQRPMRMPQFYFQELADRTSKSGLADDSP